MNTVNNHLVNVAAALALFAALAPPSSAQKFRDGLSLYFASDRSGTAGGTDISVSGRVSGDGPWGEPRNLGVTINGVTNDFCPTPTIDGHYLYFVSTSRADVCRIDQRAHGRP